MLPYVAVMAPIAVMAFLSPMRRHYGPAWVIVFVALVVFTGLRHDVGTDWSNYTARLQWITKFDLTALFARQEPAYDLLQWASGRLGWGVYAPNAVGALIFCGGLFRYARTTPSPWIALLFAVPFLVIVVSMNLARQAIALGIIFLTLSAWNNLSIWQRALSILAAGLFHNSAAVLIVLTVRDLRVEIWLKFLIATFLGLAAFVVLTLQQSAEHYGRLYVYGEHVTESSGAVFHVALSAGPALAYFLLPRHRDVLLPDVVHRDLARLALAMVPLTMIASVAASRMSIYWFPVPMYFFAAFPLVLEGKEVRLAYRYLMTVASMGIAILWLSAANNSQNWIPYRNLLLTPTSELELCCR